MRKINNNYLGTFYIEELENREEKDRVKLNFQQYGEMIIHSPVITRKTFEEVCELIGGKPNKHVGGWSAFVGNTEYLITKSN